MKPMRLLIPGPVPLEGRIAEELAKPAVPHYGREWVEAYGETEELLQRLFRMKDARVYPIAGPAHAALEALVTTLLRPEDKALVIDNGFFGRRLREVLDAHGIETFTIHARWGSPPDMRRVEEVLSSRYVRALFAVHSETSTGMVNPLRELGTLAHEYGSLFVVDAVSSLGGLDLPCEDWRIDACFAGSQKCLGAPPGIAPVAVRSSILEGIDPGDVRAWYFNLLTWKKYRKEWGEWHPQPTTISTNVFFAFKAALESVFEEGLERRVDRHRTIGRAYREALRSLGFRTVAQEEDCSDTVSCVRPPSEVSAVDIQRRLREDFGILVAGGIGELKGEVLRIGHMGPTANVKDLLAVIEALGAILKDTLEVDVQSAVEVATSLTKGLVE
jgi:alanine-glyoxylate transaminase/serine-glyoxylate transaminase/serine-pyruvate transaminase